MLQRVLLGLAMAVSIVWSMRLPNAELFMEPELARMIFYHLPCAFISVLSLMASCYLSLQYLSKKSLDWDRRASAASELTFLFMVCTLITGIFFSKVQWQEWWHNDPRQTSFLIATLMYGAYFLIRMAFVDEAKRAANSAVYNLSMVLPVLFLVFVFPRLKLAQSTMHPNQTVQGGLLKGEYAYAFLVIFGLLTLFAFWSYRTRVRALTLEAQAEDLDAKLVDGGPTPTRGVVRPISVHPEDRTED